MEFLAGTGACLAGWSVVRAIPPGCGWLLVVLGAAEPDGGTHATGVALDFGAASWLHATREYGSLLANVAVLSAAIWLSLRLWGGWALAATCTATLVSMPLCVELVRLGLQGRGTIAGFAQASGLSLAMPGARWGLAGAGVVAVVILLRRGVRRSRCEAWSGLGLPAVTVGLILGIPGTPARGFGDASAIYVAAALAIAVALPVRASPRPGLAIRPLFASSVFAVGVLVAALPVSPTRAAERVEWAEIASAGWRLRFDARAFGPAQRAEWLAGADERLEKARRRLGLPVAGEPLGLRVVSSEEAMASLVARGRRAESYALEAPGGPVLIAAPGLVPEDPRAEALLAMGQAWGTATVPSVARALARYAAGPAGGESLAVSAARIACEERQYSAREVFGVDGEYLSPLVRDAVGGAWVERAVRHHGTGVLAQLHGASLADSIALCEDCVPPCIESLGRQAGPRELPAYVKGISFSHEGRHGRGYGSAAAQRQLRTIRELGANAVALVPYAFTPAPERAEIRFRTLETDARVARSGNVARDLGLAVMLKPHLWAGRRFHGDISFSSPGRFAEWFADYRRWILHHARLAEREGFELFSVGNELAGLTGHASAWRSLIADVRRVYRGPLTYGAHWEGELERVEFWDALDYIGVNFYFPLAAPGRPPAADSPELAQAAARIERVRDRFGRPVMFTEVGFPALATAAARPWEENGSPLDLELQAACYAIWMEAFASRPGVRGMYWWKWPSDGQAGPFDTSHRPLGKPAMKVLRDCFARL